MMLLMPFHLALKDARRKDPSTFDWLLALEV